MSPLPPTPAPPLVPAWMWSFAAVLPIKRAIMAFPVPLADARQRMLAAATTPWMVGQRTAVFNEQRVYHRYDVSVVGDVITIDGPRGVRAWPLATQGVLSTTPDGCALHITSRLAGRYAFLIIGFIFAMVALGGALIGPGMVVGPAPWWIGPLAGSIVTSSVLILPYSGFVFGVKYGARFIREQCGRTILGVPRVEIL
jgi:hypothetical protein